MVNKHYERFERFRHLLANRGLELDVKYKDESWLMRAIGFILFFNKSFMTRYTTVIGSTVYFPTRSAVENAVSDGRCLVLAHEAVHKADSSGFFKSILFILLYLCPQILAPFMWLFAFINVWLALALFIAFLAPIPSPYRMYYELRSYKMTLLSANELQKEFDISKEERERILRRSIPTINKNFTGSMYYFMWPFGVEKRLNSAVDAVLSGNLLKNKVYKEIIEDFRNSKIQ